MDEKLRVRSESEFVSNRRRPERMSMMPVSSTAASSFMDGVSPSGTRKKRTLSVDTGMTALVTQFYEDRLKEAKDNANGVWRGGDNDNE